MVDTRDLKSLGLKGLCRFESGLRHIVYLGVAFHARSAGGFHETEIECIR